MLDTSAGPSESPFLWLQIVFIKALVDALLRCKGESLPCRGVKNLCLLLFWLARILASAGLNELRLLDDWKNSFLAWLAETEESFISRLRCAWIWAGLLTFARGLPIVRLCCLMGLNGVDAFESIPTLAGLLAKLNWD